MRRSFMLGVTINAMVFALLVGPSLPRVYQTGHLVFVLGLGGIGIILNGGVSIFFLEEFVIPDVWQNLLCVIACIVVSWALAIYDIQPLALYILLLGTPVIHFATHAFGFLLELLGHEE